MRKSRLLLLCVVGVTVFWGFSLFAKGPSVIIPDIKDIPELSKDSPPGTIAWVLIDRFHPTQAQTGHREVRRKARLYQALLENAKGEFPHELYEEMYRNFISPVYLAPIPETDSRYNTKPFSEADDEDFLAYNTDRTHTMFAMAMAIEKVYGRRALSKLIEKGQRYNIVLVRVEENKTKMKYSKFVEFMDKKKHDYLKLWSKGRDGGTVIKDIKFEQIPEQVYETTDNPFRSLVSWLQGEKILGRADSDYSQFIDAEILAKHSGVKWADIDEFASKKELKRARKKATKFIESGSTEALSMPGVMILKSRAAACKGPVSELSKR